MFENEVLISETDKGKLLYYIRKINEILNKYPYNVCYAHTVSTMSRAKSAAHEAEEWISYLHTPITEKHLTDCCIELKKGCLMKCEDCICKDCDKRFDCDGGNPLTGCGQ